MTNIARNILGINSGWTDAGFIQSSFDSGANGTFWQAASYQTGSLDLMGEFWFKAYVGGTVTSGAYFALWIQEELPDGSYGDGVTNGTGLPSANYLVATSGVKAGITSGSAIYGKFKNYPIPIDNYKYGISQHSGIALNSVSSMTCQYRTKNYNLNS